MVRKFSGEQSASTSNSDETEIVCENGVCYKRPKVKTNQTVESSAATDKSMVSNEVDGNAQQLSNEEKLERAKNLLEKKRKEKEEENERVRGIWFLSILCSDQMFVFVFNVSRCFFLSS